MRNFLKRCRGVFGMGLTWAVAIGGLFFTLALVIGFFDPDSIDPGESLLLVARIGALVGFIAGSAFGLVMSFAEARKRILNLSLTRAGLWGAIASSLFPLLTTANDNMVILMAPIGAVLGATSVGLAKRAERIRARLPSA
jgi:hypothetical protein